MRWACRARPYRIGRVVRVRRRSKRRQSSARLYHVGLDDLVADDVEVVTASIDTPSGKDLHVLRGLAGTTCKVFFSDDELMLTLGTGRPGMKVLDVSDEWVRIEYERASGVGKRQTVVQLVDVNAIESFVIAGDAS